VRTCAGAPDLPTPVEGILGKPPGCGIVAKALDHCRGIGEVRLLFGSADQVEKFTIFNIAGNKYRLIVVIHYPKTVYVRHILTHKEYETDKWKKSRD
jgi:hypothetical protein